MQKIPRYAIKSGVQFLPNVSNTIAIMAGKGGVGKSTIAVNLALALAKLGVKVGIVDADLYGPSVPKLLNIPETQLKVEDNKIIPYLWEGIPVVSMNFLLKADEPVMWRGPMVSQALTQFMLQTSWPKLDYLVIDMPPGTGVIALTLAQKLPLTAVIAVAVAQQLALNDVVKTINMYKNLKIPILGVIENMSNYTCPHCAHNSVIFGDRVLAEWASTKKLEVLANIPLDKAIMDLTIWQHNSTTNVFCELATKIPQALSKLPKTLPIVVC